MNNAYCKTCETETTQSGRCGMCGDSEGLVSSDKDNLLFDLRRLRNRLMCYHNGTYGRTTVKMHVELKMIDDIKNQIEND